MTKLRSEITTNGKAVFYATMWSDFLKAAWDCGWELGLHGSLSSDMDIMAMPWTKEAVKPDTLVKNLEACLNIPENGFKIPTIVDFFRANNRVVYTVHIWDDFYLDISIIETDSEYLSKQTVPKLI
jgi:hypothetical protein